MNKDNHLIYESLVQSRAPISDEQAAKMIADKIKGTPNLNIQNIKMYVQKYLGLVGKAPSDIDFIASMVHDNLQHMGMGENAENTQPGAGPDAALRNTGAGENAEGMSDAEYHNARKDAFEDAGEELGHGPIKVQLKKNTTIDCYKAGTVQGVRFAKGTIFNCDVNVGDYYECDTEEYGGIAVFPEDVTVLKDENAEHVPLTLGEPDPALKNTGPGENAEGRPGMQTYIYLDLYTGKTSVIPSREFQDAIDGLEKVRGKMTVYKGEEYMVLVVPAGTGDTIPMSEVKKID
jgi:hypothetical protein